MSAPDFHEPLVNLREVLPGLLLDIRYATPNNFLGRAVYPAAAAFLRRSAAERLAVAQRSLAREGFQLVVWDAYRPLAIQRMLWDLLPDDRYVAPPARGSNHNRGAAVDVTLARLDGSRVEMPTDYDDFGERAHTAFPGVSPEAARHRDLLQRAMTEAGFLGIWSEWWHFDAPGAREYPLADLSFEELALPA